VDVRFLFGFDLADQQKRRRIIMLCVESDRRIVEVGVTVAAAVEAGVICPDVEALHASALYPLVFILAGALQRTSFSNNAPSTQWACSMPYCSRSIASAQVDSVSE